MIAPAETHKRTLGSFDADVSAERENIERDLDLLASSSRARCRS